MHRICCMDIRHIFHIVSGLYEFSDSICALHLNLWSLSHKSFMPFIKLNSNFIDLINIPLWQITFPFKTEKSIHMPIIFGSASIISLWSDFLYVHLHFVSCTWQFWHLLECLSENCTYFIAFITHISLSGDKEFCHKNCCRTTTITIA